MATIPSKKTPLLMPGVEEPTSATAPNPPPASKLEGATSPEDLAMVLRRWLLPYPRFSPLGLDDPEILPLEDAYSHEAMPMGTLLDITALESLQVTISHIPVTGEAHYHLQTWSTTRMSLPGTSSQEHLEPSPKI